MFKLEMETLDDPVQLKFDGGNNFPPNFVMIGYVVLVGAILLVISGVFKLGLVLLFLSLYPVTNKHVVIINPEQNFIHDFSLYLGVFKIGKKYPLDTYKYVTAMPLIESQQVYSRSSNSTTISNSFTTVTLFGEHLKGKKVISKYDSRIEAVEIAKKLGQRVGVKFFDYDPQLVRQVLLGQRTI